MNRAIWIWPFFVHCYKLIFQEIGSVLLSSHLCSLPMLWNSEATSTFLPLQKWFCPSWWPKCDSSHSPICISCFKTGDYNKNCLRLVPYLRGRYGLRDSTALLCRPSLLLRGVWQPTSSSIIHTKEIKIVPGSFLPAHHPRMPTLLQLLWLSDTSSSPFCWGNCSVFLW